MADSALTREATRLGGLSLAALRAEYIAAFGDCRGNAPNATTRNRDYLAKRVLFHWQHSDEARARREREGERKREEAAVKCEQDLALGVARGTHCWLACDRCRAEVIVPVRVKHELRRAGERGEPSRFRCEPCKAELADRDFRTRREREGLQRTIDACRRAEAGRPGKGS